MPENISVSDWIGYLDKDYLSTFIKAGGATIKFAIPDDDELKSEMVPVIRTTMGLD